MKFFLKAKVLCKHVHIVLTDAAKSMLGEPIKHKVTWSTTTKNHAFPSEDFSKSQFVM